MYIVIKTRHVCSVYRLSINKTTEVTKIFGKNVERPNVRVSKLQGSASAQPISYCSSTTCKRTMQYWPQCMLNNLRSSFFFLCIWIHWEHQCTSDRLDDCRKNKTRRLQNHMITHECVNSCNSCTSFIYSRHNIFVYMYSVLWAGVVSYIWYGVYHNDLCLLFESSTIPNSATVL